MSIRNKHSFTILRAPSGDYEEGTYTPSDEREEIPATGNIQPAKISFQSILQNPTLQGKDLSGSRFIFTNTELLTIDNAASKKADVISFEGKLYKITSTSGPRQFAGETRYHCVADLIENVED